MPTTRPMLYRLSDPALTASLCEHFERAGFAVERIGNELVGIDLPDAPSIDQERREIELHMQIWLAIETGVTVEALD